MCLNICAFHFLKRMAYSDHYQLEKHKMSYLSGSQTCLARSEPDGWALTQSFWFSESWGKAW